MKMKKKIDTVEKIAKKEFETFRSNFFVFSITKTYELWCWLTSCHVKSCLRLKGNFSQCFHSLLNTLFSLEFPEEKKNKKTWRFHFFAARSKEIFLFAFHIPLNFHVRRRFKETIAHGEEIVTLRVYYRN